MALIGHWRSDLGITLVGSDVSLWEDQSGNSNDVEQTTALNRPGFETGIHNGHSALRCDGAEWLQSLLATDLEQGTSDWTMALVFRPDIDMSSLPMGKADGNSTTQDIYFMQTAVTETLNSKFSDGSGNRISKNSAASVYDGTGISIHLCSLDFSTKALINHVNGSVDEDTTADIGGALVNIDSADKFKIGWAGTTTSNRTSSYIFEGRLYNSIEDLGALHTTLSNFYASPPAGGDLIEENLLLLLG